VRVPRLLGRGAEGQVRWSLESFVEGTVARGVDVPLLAAVRDAWCTLPVSNGTAEATVRDLHLLARLLPPHATTLRALAADVAHASAGLPGVLAHRDLWSGNLLVRDGRLVGVVDWGAWEPDGLPGADLVQLVLGDGRRRRHEPLGTAWLRRSWRELEFQRALRPYADALGLELSRELLDLLGIAWWATEVAGTLGRVPHRRTDARWLAANVDPVLAVLR
jgi:aminoglycoside phosphotransferase (APT) family kinase protein